MRVHLRARQGRSLAGKMLSLVVALTLMLGVTPAAAPAATDPPTGGKTAPERRDTIVKLRGAKSQAARDAAAARMKLQQQLTTQIGGITAAAVPVPVPGGVPDYFGSANWAFSPPLAKFINKLPGLGPDNKNDLGQYIPVGTPDTKTYPGSDYYEIELVQYAEQMHGDLPPTTLRGYRQVNKGTDADGNNTIAPDPKPHYLGPFIMATKDRPVRIKFTNKLPTGTDGDLFIPVDTTMMGAGMGPRGMEPTDSAGNPLPMNYSQNRATLHLHGGLTPWISDGTPHQWITPATERTAYPEGVSVRNVPDMPDPGDGSQTFFYTNAQSARLMFYHDHSYGITRLNVYAGEAAGYAITDDTEKKLIADGTIPSDQIPLIIQDKTFVDAATVRQTDPTWNWGTGGLDANGYKIPVTGDLWYPHVYSPAQNPADLSGMNAFGRWHYGPWFWPPTTGITHPPIPNPYYDPVNAPWENETIPAAPNPSAPGEAFMDTPLVNGTAFPTVDVDPKAYRFRVLNASDDRFWNLQLYTADPSTVSSDNRRDTEVKMVPASANPSFPADWPTDGREGGVPDPATAGPEWVQIANEGGFLPAPATIPQQPITYFNDPTTFNFGNVNLHSLLVAPAERADVIVDFSKYAGQTLILYNDAPAAFPARDPRLDYFTGDPDRTDTGGHWGTQVGFGPNTRTIMQIKVKPLAPAPAFDTTALATAFESTDTTAGVFAASQAPVIAPDKRYGTAYNKTNFPADPYARIFDFKKTVQTVNDTTLTIPFQPKALQDEMGEAFDTDYGRMSGKLGVELPGTNAGNQNFILYGYIDPSTEKVKVEMEPMAPVAGDSTQIWKITHNGVDTHPIHFHLFDVQLINRVGWDNAVRPPDDNELGWKDTVRVSPLEDTIVALRPIKPKAPFGVPESIRPLDPTMPLGSTMGFNPIDPLTGQPLSNPTTNTVVNFGWEYVWHCHILSHEEMDMMRPMVAEIGSSLPESSTLTAMDTPSGIDLTWTDPTPADLPSTWGNPANEIGFRIERAVVENGVPGQFVEVGTQLANGTTYTDMAVTGGTTYSYRVVAFNAAGETLSNEALIGPAATPAPLPATNFIATAVSSSQIDLSWTDSAGGLRTGYNIYRATTLDGLVGATPIATVTGTSFQDTGVTENTTYYYLLTAVGPGGESAGVNASATTPVAPVAAPTSLLGSTAWVSGAPRITLNWTDNANNETAFLIERAGPGGAFAQIDSVGANVTTYVDTAVTSLVTYQYRVRAFHNVGAGTYSAYAGPVSVTAADAPPAAPSGLKAVLRGTTSFVDLKWTDNANNETGFELQRSRDGVNWNTVATPAANATSFTDSVLQRKMTYYYRIRAVNAFGVSAWSPTARTSKK